MNFKITKNKLLISLIIVIMVVYFNSILEGFFGRRFFWGFSPPSRNTSYDTRYDREIRTKFNPRETTGVFYESAIFPNFSKGY